mgnify:CR=1 FL=1
MNKDFWELLDEIYEVVYKDDPDYIDYKTEKEEEDE